MPESNLIPLTCYSRRFPSKDSDRKRLIGRHFRRCIIHLKKQQAEREKKKKHSKALPYHKCTHFPKQGGEFC